MDLSGLNQSRLRNKNIKIYIGIALSVLVTLILVSIFISSDWKERAKSIVCSFNNSDNKSSVYKSRKTDETDKDKQEEIQKLKDQLTALDTKITEAEALVSKLEERNYRSKTRY